MNKKTKAKRGYIEEVSQTLFHEFMKLPKDERKAELELIAGSERHIKYIYALADMDIPMLAYVWGIIPYDAAKDLQSVKQMMEYENFDNALDLVDVDELDDEQHSLYLQMVESINDGNIDFDIPEQLEKLGLPEDVISKCDLSYDDVFQKLMMDEQYHVDADGKSNNMYNNIMRRFKPEYLKKLSEFKQVISLIRDRRFDEAETDLSDGAIIPTFEKSPETSQLVHELDITSGILNYFGNHDLDSPEIVKSIYYWEKIAQGYFCRIVKEMGYLPEHQQFPEIKERLKSVSKAFDSFFPKAKEQDVEICRDLLMDHIRQALKENIHKQCCTPKALEWFDKHIKTDLNKKELSEQQITYEKTINDRVAQCMYLIKEVIKKMAPLTTEQPEQSDLKPVGKTSDSVAQDVYADVSFSEQTELQKAMTEMDVLKNKYLSDDERYQIGGMRAVFSFMRDYELLYMMGVFNQEEYYLCKAYQDEYIQQRGALGIQERTVVDIFNKLLEQPNSHLLPIKKEYLAAMEQVRLASLLYQDIYTDNTVDKMCLLFDSPFENDYMAADTKLRQEGLFLEDMVLLTRHLEGTKRKNNYVVRLVNSYWEESIRQLSELPAYQGRPEVIKQIRDNMVLFESDSNMDKKNQKKQHSFKTRRLLYQRLLSQLHYEICEKYVSDLNKRARALSAFARYLEPFERRLKITMNEQLKLYFGKTLLKAGRSKE